MARRTKRLWTDEEKRSICLQTTAPGVSVAQVARRYAANANMVFKWLRDPRYAPETTTVAATPAFLPVEIIDHVRKDDLVVTSEPTRPQELIEVELAGGHRMRITGSYDPEALARLIRGLTA
ncbi:IS66-like element accessory protein TnpA [Paracoccus haeundaensis]|uniref:IS66-like element accessory protein TnpA n=1 Tax=Paracoccus haeundaensis TaxID=225362 RepID=UPI001FE28B7A|nr:transposase [Paracoccus haeundaensis]